MKAAVMMALGGPDVLQLQEVPEPQLRSACDTIVRLRAAGINPVDYKQRSRGTLGGGLPAILGWDGAGVVEAVGPDVARVKVGDDVYFCDGGFGRAPGTYAQKKAVDERHLALKPTNLSYLEAAAAPLVTITAWEALNDRARVQEGQSVLVQGGAGGVGHVAVQLARIAGARVAATVSAGAKMQLAQALGVERCIDYRGEDVVAAVREWTGGSGVDVVHDTVGGATFGASFALVRPYGDLVSNVGGAWSEAALDLFRRHNLRASATWMPAPALFEWPLERDRQTHILEAATELFEVGTLRLHVGAVFTLKQVAEAHRTLETGTVPGKIVLRID